MEEPTKLEEHVAYAQKFANEKVEEGKVWIMLSWRCILVMDYSFSLHNRPMLIHCTRTGSNLSSVLRVNIGH